MGKFGITVSVIAALWLVTVIVVGAVQWDDPSGIYVLTLALLYALYGGVGLVVGLAMLPFIRVRDLGAAILAGTGVGAGVGFTGCLALSFTESLI